MLTYRPDNRVDAQSILTTSDKNDIESGQEQLRRLLVHVKESKGSAQGQRQDVFLENFNNLSNQIYLAKKKTKNEKNSISGNLLIVTFIYETLPQLNWSY